MRYHTLTPLLIPQSTSHHSQNPILFRNLIRPPFLNLFHSPLKSNTLSGNNIKSLYYENNQLWIGTYNAGLDHYDVKNKSFINYGKGAKGWDKFSSLNVYSLIKVKSLIYVLTYGGGLNLLDIEKKKVIQIQHDPKRKESLSNNLGRTLILDKSGN